MTIADIAAQLKAARPRQLKVVLSDGTEKKVAVPGGRTKWFTAARIIDGMSWSEVYCLDGAGAVTAPPIRQEDSAPPSELESLPSNPTTSIVLGVTAALAPLTREIVRTVMGGSVELLTKLKDSGSKELESIISGYRGITEAALESRTQMEERANALMADNDELRAQVASLQAAAVATKGDDYDANIGAIIKHMTGVDPEKAKAPEEGAGKNGAGGG